MHLGLRPFTMCIALAMALVTNISVLIQNYSNVSGSYLTFKRCISNGYGLFVSKRSVWQICLQKPYFLNLFLQGVQANLVLKHVFGHRPCPIAYSAFKSVLIITNFSILLSKHFNQCYNFVLLRALACFVLKT